MKGTLRFISFALVIVAAVATVWFASLSRASTSQSTEAATPALAMAPATTAIPASGTAAGQSATAPSSTKSAPSTPPPGSIVYSNPQFHFALDYPSNLQLHAYDEQGGGFTAAFQDPATNEGFEVYVTPYSGTQITAQEFKLDEPSGVMQHPTNVIIDGTQATMFYGSNATMGDTREVWFIRGGLLYEVTTYKQLDAWLAQLMQTWTFI